MELRMVMPNRVTKPTMLPTVIRPPVANTASTPPTSAKGSFTSTRSRLRRWRKTTASNNRMPAAATLVDEGSQIAAAHIASHRLAAAGAVVQNDGAAGVFVDVGQFGQGHAQAVLAGQHQVAHGLGVLADVFIEDHGHVEHAARFV